MAKACPRCGSHNTTYELVTEHFSKRKHRSIIMWILFWWWFELILWIFWTIPRLLIALFFPKRKTVYSRTKTVFFCRDCGFQQ